MAVIAIDWDHTLMNGKEWVSGAQKALNLFREYGHTIVIHSCNEKSWIERQLAEAGIAATVSEKKPVAALYIDDRGYRFEGWDGNECERILSLL